MKRNMNLKEIEEYEETYKIENIIKEYEEE